LKLKSILILIAILAVAGTAYFFISRPKPPPEQPIKYYVWDFEMESLQHITISLPKEGTDGLSASFIKHPDDRNFYFDVENGPKVDVQRWGGGIPLLLSGPGASREPIIQNATEAQLAEFGINKPNMIQKLTVNENDQNRVIEVQVGDISPDGSNYYVRLASNNDVYTVDKSWYDVLKAIVIDPPYVPATFVVDRPTFTPAQISVGDEVTISVNVNNNGDRRGAFDVVMKINSELIETQTVTLDARTSQIVNFKVKENKAGSYVVSINTRTTTFVVK
jgi:hypothetical protein